MKLIKSLTNGVRSNVLTIIGLVLILAGILCLHFFSASVLLTKVGGQVMLLGILVAVIGLSDIHTTIITKWRAHRRKR